MSARKKAVRDAFREAVFARDGRKCVSCFSAAKDAHHVLSRDLFPDGGYHVDNGVSLCHECHKEAEAGDLSPEFLRELAGIKTPYLPPLSCPECREELAEEDRERLELLAGRADRYGMEALPETFQVAVERRLCVACTEGLP